MPARSLRRQSLKLATPVLLSAVGICQPPPSVKQESKSSPCSNIVALAGNVSMNCSSLTPSQQKLIASIPGLLTKILASQVDPDTLTSKLDEIISNQRIQTHRLEAIQSGTWKTLSETEIQAAAKTLASFRGQRVRIVVANRDASRMTVAEQWARIFKLAEWGWEGIETPMTFSAPTADQPHGIHLHVGVVNTAAEALGATLIHLYGKENIPNGFKDDKFRKDLIEIEVFYK